MSKKELRLGRKKRKAEAFLAVARLNDDEKPKRVKRNNSSGSSDDEEEQEQHVSKAPASVLSSETWHQSLKKSNDDADANIKESLQKLKAEMRTRQKASLGKAKVFLTLDELKNTMKSTGFDTEGTPALFMQDLQNLILNGIQGNICSFKPRWCRIMRMGKIKSVIILAIDGIDKDIYQKYSSRFDSISDQAETSAEFVHPRQYNRTIMDELFKVPKSNQQLKYKNQAEGKAWSETKTKVSESRSTIPVLVNQKETSVKSSSGCKISRCKLLLNTHQMIEENCPLPIDGTSRTNCDNYTFTNDQYKVVSDSSPLFAIDCEMCQTGVSAKALTWIGVVNEKLETVYETLVKPREPITNYVTMYSGIRKEMLKDVTTRLEDVQHTLRNILPPDAILCGQSFANDLHAMQMFHPYIIDTSVIYNLKGARRMKTSLRDLAKTFLDKDIQCGQAGHNPVEDARITMELVQLKLRNGAAFGDVILGGPLLHSLSERETENKDDIPAETSRETEPHTEAVESSDTEDVGGNTTQKIAFFHRYGMQFHDSLFDIIKESVKRTGRVIGPEGELDSLKETGATLISCSSDKEAVKELKISEDFLSFVKLNCYGDHKDSDSVDEDNMIHVNKTIKKALKHAGDNALVITLFTGNNTAKDNADPGIIKQFMKIT